MASTIKDLPKDVWTLVLTNVTYAGQVHSLSMDPLPEPTAYLVALVNTGATAPAADFAGGVDVKRSFSPANSTASDYYMMPVSANGKVVILT